MNTAEYFAREIAGVINLCYPQDSVKIFQNLTHVNNEIWKSGKFYNCMKWFHVKVFPDGTLLTPHGYNILLGVDINGRPVTLRDQLFLFHENGPGDVTEVSNRLDGNVYDLGEFPVLFQPTDADSCKCYCVDREPKRIMVKAICNDYVNNSLNTLVSGIDGRGDIIYSYPSKEDDSDEVIYCPCTAQESTEFEGAVMGVEYPISSRGVLYKNITFSTITNIIKDPTPVPVEYWAVDKSGKGMMIARLEPYQIYSKYRKYTVPVRCRKTGCVLALFKMSQPDPIVHGNQLLVSSNLEAIKSMAIAVDFKYDKKDMNSAAPYLLDAARQLNSEVRENRSNAKRQLQVKQGYAQFPKL